VTPFDEICSKYERPHVDVFANDSWRVVCWNWHVHHSCGHGTMSGYGKTFEEACARLLESASVKHASPTAGSCTDECFYRNSDARNAAPKLRAVR